MPWYCMEHAWHATRFMRRQCCDFAHGLKSSSLQLCGIKLVPLETLQMPSTIALQQSASRNEPIVLTELD
eukprot:3915360-Amphidinium_carterae.2